MPDVHDGHLGAPIGVTAGNTAAGEHVECVSSVEQLSVVWALRGCCSGLNEEPNPCSQISARRSWFFCEKEGVSDVLT